MEKGSDTIWCIILNPNAGGGKGHKDWHIIERLLIKYHVQFNVLVSEYPKHAVSLSKKAVEKGARNIIVAGGDGTLNEVVNGIFNQNCCKPEAIRLGVIPVGTGNDWIKTFGVPNNYKGAVAKICKGKTILQDVGKFTFNEKGVDQKRYFVNMAGFGFDALAAREANNLKMRLGKGSWIYLVGLLLAYLKCKTRETTMLVDSKEIRDHVFTASIGIGKYNGGGMMQAPNAVPDNGLFEFTYVKAIGLWGILTNLKALYKGSYIKDRRVVCNKATRISLSSKHQLVAEVDGEFLGEGRFVVEIIPRKLRVIVG